MRKVNIYTNKGLNTDIHEAALLIIVKNWKQLRCLESREWMKKMLNSHIVKMTTIQQTHVTKINLKTIMWVNGIWLHIEILLCIKSKYCKQTYTYRQLFSANRGQGADWKRTQDKWQKWFLSGLWWWFHACVQLSNLI